MLNKNFISSQNLFASSSAHIELCPLVEYAYAV
jgi:hypothetical protein